MPLATAADSVSVPPATVSLMTRPPLDTMDAPPLLTVVAVAVAPDRIVSLPPTDTTVPDVALPDETVSKAPFVTAMPDIVSPVIVTWTKPFKPPLMLPKPATERAADHDLAARLNGKSGYISPVRTIVPPLSTVVFVADPGANRSERLESEFTVADSVIPPSLLVAVMTPPLLVKVIV